MSLVNIYRSINGFDFIPFTHEALTEHLICFPFNFSSGLLLQIPLFSFIKKNYFFNISDSIYFLIGIYRINAIIKFIILSSLFIIEIAEAASYYTTNQTFSLQFFYSIDIRDAFTNLRSVFLLVLCMFIGVELLILSNIAYPPKLVNFSWVNILNILVALFIFLKFTFIYNDLFEVFRQNSFQSNSKLIHLIKYILQKPKIVSLNPKTPKKNLLLYVIESFELQNLGPFNQEFKTLMPFLSSVAMNSSILTNVIPQPLTGFSMPSFFCAICGFPVLFTPNVKYIGTRHGDIQLSPMFKCIPDILHSLNYSNYFVMTGNHNWGNIQDFARIHKYKVISSANHGGKEDQEAMRWTNNNLLPKLKNDQPFFLTYQNLDTHNGRLPNKCMKSQTKSQKKKFFGEYDCLDLYLEELFIALKKNGLYENTEIIIYGDHFFMGQTYSFVAPRTLAIILPKHKYGNITIKTSLYDMTHLILHLLGIKVTPPFPFGDDPLSSNYKYSPPSSDDIKILARLYFDFILSKKKLLIKH